jgi:hypothetical protein
MSEPTPSLCEVFTCDDKPSLPPLPSASGVITPSLLEVENDLTKLSQSLVEGRNLITALQKQQDDGQLIDVKLFTNQYATLLEQGQTLITTVTYIISSSSMPFPEAISAAGTLIASIRSLIQDLLQLYRDQVKFQQQVKLTHIKHELKKDEITHKFDLSSKLIQQQRGIIPIESEEMVDYRQENAVEELLEQPGDTEK